MSRPSLTQTELQHIEHCNKILKEHLDLIRMTTEESKKLFESYNPSLHDYVKVIHGIQIEFARIVMEIVKSGKDLRGITGGSQELANYMHAAIKLNAILDDKLIEKIIRLTKDDSSKVQIEFQSGVKL